MKAIPKTKIPSRVLQIIRDNIKGFENSLKMKIDNPQSAKDSINKLRSYLNANEWGIIEVSEIAEYFFALKSRAIKFPPQFRTVLIIKECGEVLQFLESHFDIAYFGDGLMVSETMEDFINEIKKQKGNV